MKRCFLGVCIILLFTLCAHATLTIHIQSPWRDDASKEGYFLHILGSAGGGYNAAYGATSTTITTSDGDGWFTYVWDKTLSDFQDWMSFTVSIFPNTEDQNFNNNNGTAWKEAGEIKMGVLFGSDTEIWLYTNTADKSYTKSFVAPGSKIVMFKSPWGNKALPQMFFGADSVLMRYVNDNPAFCGWFYGALTPKMLADNLIHSAYFTRYRTPYMVLPKEGTLDLSAALDLMDTVFIDGSDGVNLGLDFSMGSTGACFDSSRTLHVFHPWRSNTSYRDSLVYITVGNNIINNPIPMEIDKQYKYWNTYNFTPEQVNTQNWSSNGAFFNIYRRQNEWPPVTFFTEAQRPLVSEFFPTGVYEAWIYTRNNGAYDLMFSPLEPKVVRLLSPWDNMTPAMYVADDTIKMGPLPTDFNKDTCGWYQGIYYKHTDDWSVKFRQTFGMEYYAGTGLVEEGKLVDSLISLDSIFALHDTVWIYPYPVSNSAPRDTNAFPGRLGVCPSMKISALVVDWAGESFDDAIDVDFGNIYNGNEYTTVTFLDSLGTLTTKQTCGGLAKGMVQDRLVNGLPARVDSLDFPWSICTAGREIEKWFVPVEVAKDAQGNSYTNGVCRDIDLTLDEEGFWLADITGGETKMFFSVKDSSVIEDTTGIPSSMYFSKDTITGFFPVDDFEYLDEAKTIVNPKFDKKRNPSEYNKQMHNYSFAMKVSAQFKYIPGQYFEFRGDDDVWVFIDNRLVVDIGGCHNPEEGAVDLDTMGLEEGKEYSFHIFFSERNATGSNFKMRTSINLQTQKTYLPVEVPHVDGIVEFNILQLLIDESISCDVSSTTKIDTALAQSVFVLYDGAGFLPKEGKVLDPGLNYGGININENMAGFTIDTSAIVRSRSLPSGNYLLRFALASDPSQYSEIVFTVPEYPLSEIAFVDENDEAIRDIEGKIQTVIEDIPLGEYAFVTYPIRITMLFLNSILDSNVVSLSLSSPDSLIFFNSNNEQITEVQTDGTGFADFYVMATDDVVNGSFSIGGPAVGNSLTWRNINLKKPPVPYASNGFMYDRNGDGVPDSLYVPFNEDFGDDVPDTLDWTFGDSVSHKISSVVMVVNYIQNDSVVVIVGDSLLNKVFTGKDNEVYNGLFRYHYTHVDDETGDVVPLDMKAPIHDKVGPILTKAIIIPQSDTYSKLTLTMSEGIKFNKEDARSLFEFKVWRMGQESSAQAVISSITQNRNKSQMELLFYAPEGGVIPTVGDSVRLVPNGTFDLSDNPAHVNNPWVRITGEPRAEIEVPGLVHLDAETMPVWQKGEEGIVPVAASISESIKDVMNRTGLPGHLLRYELSELVMSDEMLSTVRIKWEVSYFSNMGQFVNHSSGVIACNDSTVFNLDPSLPKNCRDNPANVFLQWNGRSETGRLVGTGAYISKFGYKIISGSETVTDKDETYTLGISRRKSR